MRDKTGSKHGRVDYLEGSETNQAELLLQLLVGVVDAELLETVPLE